MHQPLIPNFSADEIAAIQTRGLLWTVEHTAKNSPQYQEKFKQAGLQAGDIKSLDDLPHLPLTTVEDLRGGYPLPLLSVPQSEVVRIHASSGTTGKRKILAYSKKDVETFSMQMARCFELAGLTREDRIQIAVGYGLWTAGVGFQLGAEYLGAMAVPIGAGNLEIHLQMLADMGSTCLGCTASMALLMSEEVQRHGLQDQLKLKSVIFGAEGHSPKMRKVFEEQLGIKHSFDIGGMTEMYGPGTALECTAHNGLHYWADLFIIEVLDPITLQPVAEGEIGEMVVTSLRKEASPLIRYRTRDLTRMLSGSCSCGCSMPRHDHLLGRSDDMIIFRGVNIYPGQVADVLLGFPELGSEYHLVLNRNDGRDCMTIRVEVAAAMPDAETCTHISKQLAKAIHAKLLVSGEVELVELGGLSRSFGKTKRITDNRQLD